MVRSPRCAHDRARPGSAAGTRAGGRPPRRPPRSKRKKRGGRRSLGEGRGAGAARSRQKIPRKGEGSPLSSSLPPGTENYLEITSNLLGHFSHFPPLPGRQSPFSRRPEAALWEAGRVPASPSTPASLGVRWGPRGRRAARGCRALGRAGTRTAESSACPRTDPRIYI